MWCTWYGGESPRRASDSITERPSGPSAWETGNVTSVFEEPKHVSPFVVNSDIGVYTSESELLSRDDLTPFSYTILVLVGRGGAGPHDLVRMARQGRIYAAAADSQFYAEPKRLERLGYLSSRKEPGRTRERTHYSLTRKGLKALRELGAGAGALPARPPRGRRAALGRRPRRREARAGEHRDASRRARRARRRSSTKAKTPRPRFRIARSTSASTTVSLGGWSPRTANGSPRSSASSVSRAAIRRPAAGNGGAGA